MRAHCMHLFTDRLYIVKKAPYLLNEMINICAVLVAWGHAGRSKSNGDIASPVAFIH